MVPVALVNEPMLRTRRTAWRWLGLGAVLCGAVACAGRTSAPRLPTTGHTHPSADTARAPLDTEEPAAILDAAEEALAAERSARAVALFGRYLALDAGGSAPLSGTSQAYLGLARAHEQLRDCAAAIRAYDAFLVRFGEPAEDAVSAWARRGACEAELGRWEASASSFRAVTEQQDQLPSVYVEALAREGFALFNLERFDEADAALARADQIFERAQQEHAERFGSYYFLGMARFYRAAILHRRFRAVEIKLPEKVMEAAFKRKLELLVAAQQAYNRTIRAKHMFWVSASGYQLGHLFGEFYDALMYAPVPRWLDERQRKIYYEELKKQLRPVIDKAVWVFEKNLETARRLGYQSPFIERTEAKLGHLQTVMLSDEANLGRANPRLIRETEEEVGPPIRREGEPRPPADRKLFVPPPTEL